MKKLLLSCMLLLGVLSSNAQCFATSTPTNDGTDGDAIDTFTLNGVATVGNYGCPNNGYNSFSTPVRTLALGGTYAFSADVGGPGAYDEGLAIWIDLDNNGIYTTTEQVYASSFAGTFHTGTFTIPFAASVGTNIKMRVRCAFDVTIAPNEACLDDVGGYGETEDYLVDIICPAPPALTIAPSNTLLCLGETTTLTASGGANYAWTGGAITITNGIGFSPSASGSYTVTSSIPACPGSSATAVRVVSVTSTPLNVTASVSSAAACSGSTVQLNGFGASNYTWSPGNFTGSSPVITATANTTFTMIGYNGYGCPGTVTVGIIVTTPTLMITASNSTVCPGTAVTLTVAGANTYTWAANNSTNAIISISPTSATNISVIGTASNCQVSANYFIAVNIAPTLSISASKTLICAGDNVTLTALGSSDAYAWNNSSPTVSAGIAVTPISTTVYSVTGTFTNTGCSGTSTIEVTVFKPIISISPNSPTVCPGTILTLTVSGGSSGYSWSPGGSLSSVQTITANIPTTYTASAFSPTTAGLSCQGTETVLVNVHPDPNITASSNHTEICKGEIVTITASGGVSYTWTGTNTNSVSIESSPDLGYYIYSVQGTDANGCISSGTVSLKVNSCTGLNSYNSGEQIFSAYPNPNNGTFTIEASSNLNFILTNELGQIIKTFQFNGSNKEHISVSGLSKGVYFISGENEGGNINRKVIVVQ